jgi:hypothetical protein
MKSVTSFPMTLLLIFTLIIGCGTGKQVSRPIFIIEMLGNTATVQPPVIQDTLQQYKTPDTAKIRRVLMKPVETLIDARSPSYDTLLKYNFKWQQSYLRLVDSNIKRRVQRDAFKQSKDSALIVAKQTRGMVERLQDKRGATQSVGESVISLSDTVAGYLIYYIAAIITVHFIFIIFRRKKQLA